MLLSVLSSALLLLFISLTVFLFFLLLLVLVPFVFYRVLAFVSGECSRERSDDGACYAVASFSA